MALTRKRGARQLPLALPGPYELPKGLVFLGLVPAQGGAILKIRLSPGHDTTLDLPLSEATLTDLIDALCSLRGVSPRGMAKALEELRSRGISVLSDE